MVPRQEHDEKSVLEKHGGRKHKNGNIRLTLVVPQANDLTNIGQHIKGVPKELEKKNPSSRADTKASSGTVNQHSLCRARLHSPILS